jgi:hypothetical protein
VAATISTAGNVGIGTTSPSVKLHISSSYEALRLAALNDTSPTWMQFQTSAGSGLGYFGVEGNTGGTFFTGTLANATALSSGASGTALQLGTAGSVKMTILSGGNVGIGKNNPSVPLDVVGDLTASGTITGGTIKAKYQDVAEWVLSSESIPTGTVVVLDSTKSNQVVSSTQSYDTRVAGVVSEKPGIALGEGGANKVLVATTGRVLVKVDASNGPIHIGDLLVTSDIPGLAMKSEPITIGNRKMHMPGTLIGKALEPLAKGSGRILVLLSLQ